MSTAEREDLVSEAEYLAREAASDEKHEFVNGRVTAMAGGSARHSLIAANLGRAIGNALQAGGHRCMVFQSDLRVHAAATGLYTYPDLSVVCGEVRFAAASPSTLTNPTLLFEVLSPATEGHDRGAKSAHYRRIESLAAYVLVAQSERRVEHYQRIEGNRWILTEHTGSEAVALAALGVAIPLDAIYEGAESLPDG